MGIQSALHRDFEKILGLFDDNFNGCMQNIGEIKC